MSHIFYKAVEEELTEARRLGRGRLASIIFAAIVLLGAGAGMLVAGGMFPQKEECGPPTMLGSVIVDPCPPKLPDFESLNNVPRWIGMVVGGFIGLVVASAVAGGKEGPKPKAPESTGQRDGPAP